MKREEIVRDVAFASCDAACRNRCTCRTMGGKLKCLVRKQEAEAAVSLCFARAAEMCEQGPPFVWASERAKALRALAQGSHPAHSTQASATTTPTANPASEARRSEE